MFFDAVGVAGASAMVMAVAIARGQEYASVGVHEMEKPKRKI
ncbi:MAG: hypothetical protein U1F57_10130 [bacterium]